MNVVQIFCRPIGRHRFITEHFQGTMTEFTHPLRIIFDIANVVHRFFREATARIKDELQLADGQWMFFDAALQRMQNANRSAKAGAEVFVTSENLLSVMDRVTSLYAAIKS